MNNKEDLEEVKVEENKIQFEKEEDEKLRIIAYEKCCFTTIIFFNKYWKEESLKQYLTDFKLNTNIFKIVSIENDVETIIFEKERK